MILVTIVRRVVLLAAARAAVRVLAAVGRELPLGETERRALVQRVEGALLAEAG
jgi:hypothetical protein